MSHYVYIIRSERDGRYYVGSSHNPRIRLEHHNAGWTRSTKGRGPRKMVHMEAFDGKLLALRREREIKKMKSRKYIESLVGGGSCPDSPKGRVNREVPSTPL